MTRIVIFLLLAGCQHKQREINLDARLITLCHTCSLRVEIKENP